MKRLLTYGLLLLTILASHFVVSACQDDLPETTEVMMTFTTRAVTQGAASTAPVVEQMKQLRVIMLREDGTVVGNHLEPEINASSVTFTFTTPIQTGGEDFTFLAVANESSVQSPELTWEYELGTKLSEETINQIKARQIGNKALDINDGPIPQTKQWTVEVPQTHNHKVNQTLDFTASKISVQFKNATDEAQSLGDIKITGIGSATSGYLFAQASNDFGTQGALSDIAFTGITDLAAGSSSDVQNYYTYPVDAGNINTPTLHATWNEKNYTLPLEGITELKRNDHLKIIVTLTGHALTINYSIAPWVEEPTNIGSPTTNGGYQVDGWDNGNDIIIGGEIGGGEEPDPEPEPGDVIWEGTQEIDWGKNGGIHFTMEADKFKACYGKLIGFDFVITEGKNDPTGFAKVLDSGGTEKAYVAIPSTAQDGKITMEMDLSQHKLSEDCYLYIDGDGITLKKIYIKQQ